MTEPVIVIGAGMGGLSAALDLAARGVPVHVVEAASGPGGKAGIAEIDGVEVDTGPSVLTLPHVFDDLFRAAGTRLDEQVELREPSPAFRYLYPDGLALDVFGGPERTLESVRQTLGPDAADELAAFLTYAQNVWDAGAPNFVYGPAPTMGTLLRLGVTHFGAVRRIDSLRSMTSAIRSQVRSEPLRWLLMRYATYNGSDPATAPATLNCIAWVELGLGGYGVTGGIHALVRALERVAGERGATFTYDTPVRRIAVEGGRAIGVETDRGLLRGRAVIANADASHVLADLLPEERSAGLRKVETPSMSGYNAIYRARSADRVAHTVAFPERYEEEFEDIFRRDRPPRDPTVYACAQSVCHGRGRWPDGEPLFVMANAPAEPEAGPRAPEVWATLAERVEARLRATGLIGPEDPAVWRRTPTDLAARFLGSRGALYGAASNSTLAAFRRPANRLPKLPGLYLASGSAHPGGGVPLCALSGRAAARALGEDLGGASRSARRPA